MAVSSLEKKELISDYCVLGGSKDNRLSDIERMTLTGGGDLLKLLQRVSKGHIPVDLNAIIDGIEPNSVHEGHIFYSKLCQPSEIFRKPMGVISPKIIPVHCLSHEGEISDLVFESAYTGLHSSFQTLKTAIPENTTVCARYWRHKEARPTIIAVHGFAMGDHKSNSLAFLPGLFFRMGFDIVLMELPFHGKRLTPEFRDIGHNFFPGPNVFMTNEGILQSISDLRQLRLILKALGCKEIGCIGVSLGAYLASLWATLDSLSFCVPMVPLASMSEIIQDGIASRRPDLLQGDTLAKLTEVLQIHSPMRYEAKTAPEKVLIVAGTDDVTIPRFHPEKLADHFKGASVVWFSGDHGMSQDRDFIFNSILSFFQTNKFLS